MNDYLKKKIFFAASIILAAVSISGISGATMTPSEATAIRTKFVQYSKKYVGTPYAEGAIGPDAFDCSGFVFSCARESTGYQLPRMTKAMYSFVTIIPDDERQTGDLLFFKTTADPDVSHVGIYLGNDQFIHSASDGPNTGVIVSSLRENYWKSKFFCTGRFLPEGQTETHAAPAVERTEEPAALPAAVKKSAVRTSDAGSLPFIIDTSFSIDWNFFTANYFKLAFRGIDASVHARYATSALQPGIGAFFRYDSGTGIFQIPIVASLSVSDYLRIYAGPVISIGTPYLPGDSSTNIHPSFFPGIIGIIWETPSYTVGQLKLAFVQDLHYTVFNTTDDAALSFTDSVATGLVFSSGLRVTLPGTGLSH